jgi:signal transduction histidine kinase
MANDESVWVAAIADASGGAVVLLDERGELLAADGSALRLLGAESRDNARAMWHEQHAPRMRDGLPAADATPGELELPGADGATRVSARAIAMEDGRRLLLLGARPTPAEERVAFARKLGHDLRGPLNAMVLNLDLLRTTLEMSEEDVDEASRAKRTRYLASLHREIGRMSDMLAAAVAEMRAAG